MNKFYTTILALGITLTACTKPNDDDIFDVVETTTEETITLETLEVVKSPSTASKGASTSKSNNPYVIINGVEYDLDLIEENWDEDDGDNMRALEDVFEVQISNEDGELTAWFKLRIQVLGNTDTNEIEHLFVVSYDKTQGQESYQELSMFNVDGTFNNGDYNIEVEF